ncbi:MAG TPA: hypothetical protein VM432_12100 [Bdellovibrionales bacterium]|nr:hypothetical protein [Bdellovibrionales bacterium]
MKRSALGFEKSIGAALVLILASLSGCSPKGPEGTRYQLPWFDRQGQYGIQVVNIKTYNEPEFFRGEAAQILVEPTDASGELTGDRPVGRYIKRSDGVIVPADQDSLMATSVYAHFERLRELDQKLGIQLKWPAKIGIQAQIFDGQRNIRDNALYDGRYDALLIVPTERARLPVALNGGVIAHEHFHGIFQAGILSSLPREAIVPHGCNWALEDAKSLDEVVRAIEAQKSTDVIKGPLVSPASYNAFLLRALNEGLADYWAWVYTGDADFIAHSLASEKESRTMGKAAEKLPSIAAINDRLRAFEFYKEKDRLQVREAYLLGTHYARFMRSMSLKLSGHKAPTFAQRAKAAQSLIAVLPRLRETVATSYSEQRISPDALVDLLSEEWARTSPESCQEIDTFSSSGKAKGCKP